MGRFPEGTDQTLDRVLSIRPDPSRSVGAVIDGDWVFRSVALGAQGEELEVEVGSTQDEGFSLTILIAFADLPLVEESDGDAAISEAAELIEVFVRQVDPSDIHEPTVRLPLDWNPLLLP